MVRRLLPPQLVAQLPQENCAELERRSTLLLADRLWAGIPAYLVIATLLFFGGSGPWTGWLFLATSVGCLGRGLALWKARRRPPKTWLGTALAFVGVAAPLAAIAGFAGYSWIVGSPLAHVMVLLAGMVLFANIVSAAFFRALALFQSAVAIAPVAAAGAYTGGDGWILAGLAILLGVYQYFLLNKLHRDYWGQLLDQELRQLGEARERLLASALENVELCVGLTHPDGRLLYANPALAEVAGIDRAAAEGRHALDLLRPTSPAASAAILDAVAGGHGWSGEEAMVSADGRELAMSGRVAPVKNDAGEVTHLVWLARDITDSRALEEQLATADKLATLGTLAAAVAHEINNPLAYVTLNLEHLGSVLHDPEQQEVLAEVLDGTERMGRTVRQLLDYARDPAAADLAAREDARACVRSVFDTATRLIQHELKHIATLEVSARAKYEAVVLPEELVQVVVNLLLNASHAVASRGRGWIALSSRDEDGEVVIEVEDDGPGVPLEHRQSVFEPLFTTKRHSGGTGLGLTHCRRIVHAAGGSIEVGEGERGGALFTVRLPAGNLARPSSGTVSRRAVAAWMAENDDAVRSGRLLIVDDEVAVARAMRRVLRQHDVTLAHSVSEALEALERRRFDLVLCDLMMPQATGADLYRALEARGDGIERTLAIMTGGVFSERESAFLEQFDGPVLTKPVPLEVLRELVAARVSAERRDSVVAAG